MSFGATAQPPSLSIVVPLYNEEENVRPLAEAIFKVLSPYPGSLELVLVDDGSHDRTAALALELVGSEPRIRLVRHERNRGLGAAIRTGLDAAEGDLILYTDADLPFDFGLIPQLLALATPDKIIIGCRANRGEGPRRWLLSKGYNLLCRGLLGLEVRDVNFACKLIPRCARQGMRLAAEGSFIDAEILLECRRQGLGIVEFPLTYYPRTRGQSTLSRPRVIAGILSEMVRYPLRASDPAGRRRAPVTRSIWQRYGVAIGGGGLALLLTLLLQPLIGFNLYLFFIPAVIFIAWYGGWGPALTATTLAALSGAYFLPPPYSLSIADPNDILRLVLFVLMALSISTFANLQKWAEYAWRKAYGLVKELDHQRR